MATNTSRQMTCRQWKLNPIGCLKGPSECEFSHRDTGRMSPASTVTCWAYKHNACKYHEDACLFAHLDTGILQTSAFSARHRPMHGKERAIAKAAALAGFDCSDIDRLMALVNAVRNAESNTTYPDYYRGNSNVQSTYPPARSIRRKGVLHSYRDADNPAVPAFAFSSDQILSGMRQYVPGDNFMGFLGTHVVETTNKQTLNLYNKRTTSSKFWPAPQKKQKTSRTQQTVTGQEVIDLTEDGLTNGAHDSRIHPSRRSQVPGASSSRPTPVTRQTRDETRAKNRERNTGVNTQSAFQRIVNILSMQLDQIHRARDTLKSRWDEDRQLQLQNVTDDLAELNRIFGRMEEAGRESLDLIQHRFIR